MPPIHRFQLPSRGHKRKRKRTQSSATVEDSFADNGIVANPEVDSPTLDALSVAGITFLTANQAEQYRVCGLPPSEQIPPCPFPHAPSTHKVGEIGPIEQKDRSGSVPTTQKQSGTGFTSLRQNHLSVLNTILHRCLLEGDYERAGRAWSLLLRSGSRFNLRQHEQWGIGAEILMRRPNQTGNSKFGATDNSDSDSGAEKHPIVSDEGLEAAKRYYERLILQFPDLRGRSFAVPRAATFYPALFSVWVFQVVEAKRKAVQDIMGTGNDGEEQTGLGSFHFTRSEGLRRIRAQELQEAETISARLEGILNSPPCDKDAELLRLKGLILLWLEDLRGERASREEIVVS